MLMPCCAWGNAFVMWDSGWAMGARRMGYYFYHDEAWFLIPKMDVRQSAKRIRYAVASGRARHFYQEFYGSGDGRHGGLCQNELLWDRAKTWIPSSTSTTPLLRPPPRP
jgi:hypothetical protein